MSKIAPEVSKLKAWADETGASVSFSVLTSGVQATVRKEGSVISAEGKDAAEASKKALELAEQVIG